MSQRAAMALMDAQIHAGLAAAGLADIGQYTPPADDGNTPTAVPVAVYVDRDVETIGELRQFKAGRVEVTYIQPSIAPVKDGCLVVDGDTYINDSKLSDDGSAVLWRVRRG